jgi:pimeloyl-ACP methyl ester carboxylesterase
MNVVLLHAFPLDSLMWEPQHEALAGHVVLAPDLYGFGSSMEEWARAILPQIDGDFVAVGASMGGYCALALARLAPERLRALVLAGSHADPDTPERRAARAVTIQQLREGGAEALWEEMQPRLLPEGADPDVVAGARELALTQDPDGLERALEAIRDRPDSTDVVAALECPVLVAVGDDDPYVPLPVAEALAERARDGRIAVFRSGHLPSLERPEEFNRALLAVLDRAAESDPDASRV